MSSDTSVGLSQAAPTANGQGDAGVGSAPPHTKTSEKQAEPECSQVRLRPFTDYLEGDGFPSEGRREATIECIADRCEKWLVFIDQEYYVRYALATGVTPPAEFRRLLNRAIDLQCYDIPEFSTEEKHNGRWLIAIGLAAALDNRIQDADAALDSTRSYIEAHNRETARAWYIRASSQYAACSAFLLGLVLLLRFIPKASLGFGARPSWKTFLEIMATAFAGGIGALLSILLRRDGLQLDAEPAGGCTGLREGRGS